MKLVSASLLALSLLATTTLAHASTIVFNASGTFTDGSLLGGTLTIDNTLGRITASNLTVTGASNFTFVNIVNQSNTQVPGDYNVGDRNAASTEDFNFDLPVTSLVGYTGSLFCSSSAPCVSGRGSGLYDLTTSRGGADLVSGSLLAPTPEPSSLALLGTGAISVLGLVRRRLRA